MWGFRFCPRENSLGNIYRHPSFCIANCGSVTLGLAKAKAKAKAKKKVVGSGVVFGERPVQVGSRDKSSLWKIGSAYEDQLNIGTSLSS